MFLIFVVSVHKYQVFVKTADVKFAGTDANVYLQIFGERGDTGKRHLHGSHGSSVQFEQGSVSHWVLFVCLFVCLFHAQDETVSEVDQDVAVW